MRDSEHMYYYTTLGGQNRSSLVDCYAFAKNMSSISNSQGLG